MEYRIQGETLRDIADSIRAVDPSIEALSPQKMDDQIRRLTAVIDQEYTKDSSNPQSGKAVAEVVEPLKETVSSYDDKINDANTNASIAKDTATEALDKINDIKENVVTQDELAWVELQTTSS